MVKEITTANFKRRWGAGIRKLSFAAKPYLPDQSNSFLQDAGLPARFRFGTLSIDFLTDAVTMENVWAEIQGEEWRLPFDWKRFWKIGDVDFGQPTAWLCLEEMSGRIVTIDPQIDTPISKVNSSLLQLGKCMLHLREWFKNTKGDLNKGTALAKLLLLRKHNPAFENELSAGFWLPIENLVEGYADYDEELPTLEVEYA